MDLQVAKKDNKNYDELRNITTSLSIHLFSPFVCDKNMKNFTVNSEIYQIETRQHANLHQPSVNLTKYQKEVYCMRIKVFNALPSYIKIESNNHNRFKKILNDLLNKKYILFIK
jgi:cell division protein FtsI/penicillin-binding protein 2